MSIIVSAVVNRRQWRSFFHFPLRLYRDNPFYVPPLLSDEKMSFAKNKNPSLEKARLQAFLAKRGKEVVGRIAVVILPNKPSQARFTRYDVINDFAVSKVLFEHVRNWATKEGAYTLVGPMGFSSLDKQGLLIEGFDQLSTSTTLYNAPYYAKHLQQLGFEKDADWIEYRITVPKTLDPRIERIALLAQKRNKYRLLHFNHKKEILPFVEEMFQMYNTSFAPLYGFTALNDLQIAAVKKQFYAVIRAEFLFVVVDENEHVIGFGIMVPSLSKALQQAQGRLFPFGWRHLKKALRFSNVLDLYLIAVNPAYFGKGVNAVILNAGIKQAIKHNISYAETGPELEDNMLVQAQWKGFETLQHKRRRSFKCRL
ncbi:MAG: GNAT family N-acetyltransferase [Sphaerochaetaceae bacterium]